MKRAIAGFALLLSCAFAAAAQTTAFNYQGSLNSGGTPANGNHDFEFALFDSLAGGTQLGSTLTRSNVAVSTGVFSVSLDFGSQFPGATRFLEIRVRPSGGGAFTPLAPRQPFTSSPYSIRSLNATQLGGIAANEYVLTSDTRLSDARLPTAGSSFYIQNQNVGPQPLTNFNISGSGTAAGRLTGGLVNSLNGYEIGFDRVLSAEGSNTSVGFSAGRVNTGTFNTYFGNNAGATLVENRFANSFFGANAGASNTGNGNSFFGSSSGLDNTSGFESSFFGRFSGASNTQGHGNTFIGSYSGQSNTTGIGNVAVGYFAGSDLTTGNNNTLIGPNADVSTGDLMRATAIGINALVAQSDSLVLGSINGVNGATADTNVGIGTTAPARRLHVANGISGAASISSSDFVIEDNSSAFQHFLTPNDIESGILFGDVTDIIAGGLIFNNAATNNGIQFRSGGNTTRMTLTGSGNLGIGTTTPDDKLDVTGSIRVSILGVAGPTPLCRNASNQISLCSSSGRYKSNINPFSAGLSLVRQLRPVSFNWREGGTLDLGLVAEDVAKIEPLLTTTNANGEIEGVKYDRVGVVLVNAVQEQQAQIETQQKVIREQSATIVRLESEIDEQRSELIALKSLICSQNPTAGICSPRK